VLICAVDEPVQFDAFSFSLRFLAGKDNTVQLASANVSIGNDVYLWGSEGKDPNLSSKDQLCPSASRTFP